MEELKVERRSFLIGAMLAPALGRAAASEREGGPMYGLIGKITAVPGERDALVAILLEGVSGMPGCLSYVVATDPADGDGIWITEVWESQASHQASLSIPSVQNAIAKGRPLIAAMGEGTVTAPVGGHGLARRSG